MILWLIPLMARYSKDHQIFPDLYQKLKKVKMSFSSLVLPNTHMPLSSFQKREDSK